MKHFCVSSIHSYDANENVCAGTEMTDDEKIDVVAREILERHRAAFEELAK